MVEPILGRRVKIVSDGTSLGTEITLADSGEHLSVTRAEVVYDAKEDLVTAKLWVVAPVSIIEGEIGEEPIKSPDQDEAAEMFKRLIQLDNTRCKTIKLLENQIKRLLSTLSLIPPCPLHQNCLPHYEKWIRSHLEEENG